MFTSDLHKSYFSIFGLASPSLRSLFLLGAFVINYFFIAPRTRSLG